MPITRTFNDIFSSNDKDQPIIENKVALQPNAEKENSPSRIHLGEKPTVEKVNEAPISGKINFWKKWLTGLYR